MIRIALIIAVTVSMARLAFAYACPDERRSLTMQDVQTTARRIDADWQRLLEFRKVLDECLIELADEELTLPEAVDRVEEAARSYYPIYLKMLSLPRKNAPTRELVAHNLIRHFAAEMEDAKGDTNGLHKTMRRLNVELAKMFPPAPTEGTARPSGTTR